MKAIALGGEKMGGYCKSGAGTELAQVQERRKREAPPPGVSLG